MSPSAWRNLCLSSVAVILVVSALGEVIDRHISRPVSSPVGWLVLGVLGAAFLAFFVSVPPLVIRWFIAKQQEIGNAAHPIVLFLAQNEQKVVRTVWVVWAIGTALAVPAAIQDWMMHR